MYVKKIQILINTLCFRDSFYLISIISIKWHWITTRGEIISIIQSIHVRKKISFTTKSRYHRSFDQNIFKKFKIIIRRLALMNFSLTVKIFFLAIFMSLCLSVYAPDGTIIYFTSSYIVALETMISWIYKLILLLPYQNFVLGN